ncbi:MAG: 4'-phosphopantetheinyl transferase superfamily protein [Clostridium sp.]|jgi:4'-phosphopantetheinyl transferase|uniref:4'-phosphopantetheinyl transferase family protein n=1 Tax=Clostridium sp. TaxID=1506 RepID=UPI0025C62FDF|nr:4'-phosphopantetheinyl transferase superfamily protein [Clostridium sp.]MCH3963492.1 4'-phosphopantetheinyl transferase superfamily protein [Clostridium sp.]MCI1714633.1 4'-phosphopantetheinyl transferase superfamily protein [Clostridium sp.]MCI1799178.1 4'-phosphopantetheinyl transferase superfamily protein [Clostridium sp.]MCI1812816.1 4'-phosphopantetheinyl transferase superfamily protein [Clostridium sp.]MCI1869706.1 4'-phosphopantetheinyl transferase superfamily protein [Clostridium sp
MSNTIKKYLFTDILSLNSKSILKYIQEKITVFILMDIDRLNGNFFELNYLTIEEKEKFYSYCQRQDKLNFLISHSVINFLFTSWLNNEINQINIKKGKFFKPYIYNKHHIQYNITHSKKRAVIALSNREVGVDVEYIDKKFEYTEIINRCFCANEISLIGKSHKKFFIAWVAKEAYFKYLGTGLYKSLNSVYISGDTEDGVYLSDKELNKEVFVYIFELEGKYVLGLCMG